jgi:hypothetical protein
MPRRLKLYFPLIENQSGKIFIRNFNCGTEIELNFQKVLFRIEEKVVGFCTQYSTTFFISTIFYVINI